MGAYIRAALVALIRFRGYEPQPVTPLRVWRWLMQFQPEDRQALTRLLSRVRFLTQKELRRGMAASNERLLERLASDGVPPDHVIYASFHDAGSSSPLTLAFLRTDARLERERCRLIDAGNAKALADATSEVETGAIVYVDDFVGSAKQFMDAHKILAPNIVGNFSEFLLVGCACEEAVFALGRIGVEPVAHLLHPKSDRPLHPQSGLLSERDRSRLLALTAELHATAGLGFRDMATMVVTYRNAANSTPLLLRGNLRQNPLVGILPRTTDL